MKPDSANKRLHANRGIYLRIGYIIAIALVILAFSYKAPDKTIIQTIEYEEPGIFIEPIITKVKEPKAPDPITDEPMTEPIIDPIIIEVDTKVIKEVDSTFKLPDIDKDVIPKDNYTHPVVDRKIYQHAEVMPEPVMGYAAYYQYLLKNLKYPSEEAHLQLEGKVSISFVVNKDGTTEKYKISDGDRKGFEVAAMKVVKNTLAWKPGMQGGKPVRVKIAVPITFKHPGNH